MYVRAEPPHLELTHHQLWTGTGQDAVAAIKKELLLLLPGINVFLDVRPRRPLACGPHPP